MGIGVCLCGGSWGVQAFNGAQGTAAVSGGVGSRQMAPLHGQVTARHKEDLISL